MEIQLKDGQRADAQNRSTVPIDPLRRVFVPIEHTTEHGMIVFRTTDKEIYARLADGSIRRAIRKERGKLARKHDKILRRTAKGL